MPDLRLEGGIVIFSKSHRFIPLIFLFLNFFITVEPCNNQHVFVPPVSIDPQAGVAQALAHFYQ